MALHCNMADLAQAFRVSTNTIQSWVRQGCPVHKRGGHGRPYEFDIADVIEWRRQRELDAITEDGENVSLEEARKRRDLAHARIAELDYAERRRDLVEIDEVHRQVSEDYARMRARLRSIGKKLAPIVLRLKKPAEIEKRIAREVDEALSELSSYEDDGSGGTGKRGSRRKS